ncbi:MAG TPA: pyridoxamine 5'-phosphate oxidase family protein, partial [Gammaproteobacteria bacterium]|nr:pyridoxamine 5'-phosphate oxidase family protein [Gammaproteobacteria bacterium]
DALDGLFEANPGARQIFDLQVELVQTSCGFAVPLFDYRGQRETLDKWARNKGRKGIEQYWQEKNRVSLDGKPTDQA